MNLLLLSPTPPPRGGIARWSETVMNYCEKLNSINIIHINTGSLTDDIVNRSFTQRYIHQLKRLFQIKKEIKKVCKNHRIKIAHITTSGSMGLVRDYVITRWLVKHSIKYVYHLHYGRIPELKRNSFELYLIRRIIKKSYKTIAIDPYTYNCLNDNSNVVFVPNPIEEIPEKTNDNKVVMYLGYVTKTKGLEELIHSWKKIHELYPDWILNIVGPFEDEYKNHLNMIYDDKSIIYFGEKSHSDAMQILSEASILVLPSYSEGFPYSICEAMYNGKAIIGSNVGSIPYLLSDNCGLVCKKKNIESLTKALCALIQNEKKRKLLSQNASIKARSNYLPSIIISRYIDIWRNSK